ncbi:MAG: 3-dehydroquinate synthase [Treponema sp.]|jgi:3-dehydroquinate synthase|nr:3-dehydroquinate synthase [Treponema sp.]
MKTEFSFNFGAFPSRVVIREELPALEEIAGAGFSEGGKALLVCDGNTEVFARAVAGNSAVPLCVLPPGENSKTWASAESVIRAAKEGGLGRDGVFIGVGGGVVSDLTAFCASVYMRGASLRLVSTTLLGMVDAGVGGKTGFDLLGIKNLTGTFYPAELVWMPVSCLDTLPEREWKSGIAELLKTAILEGGGFWDLAKTLKDSRKALASCIARCAAFKGRIVEADPRESAGSGGGNTRAVLNLGHTFGHALEAAAGLGVLTHGEAVAWGMVRSCELGSVLGVTPRERALEIQKTIAAFGYEIRDPHPRCKDPGVFMKALEGDKKKKSGKLQFVVPARQGAECLEIGTFRDSENSSGEELILRIINGEYPL